MGSKPLPIAAAIAVALAATAGAQSPQYTAPGGGGSAGGTLTKEAIEQQMESARWRLGPIRLAPWLGIRGLTYVDNVFAESSGGTSDVTATLSAGLTAYLPTGPNWFWVAQAMPEYIYWLDLSDRRQFVGRYGAGLYGAFNRLQVSAHATTVEEQAVVTSEELQPALANRDRLAADLAVQLSGAFYLTAGAEGAKVADRAEDPADPREADYRLLDRQERRLRAGLRWKPTDKIQLEAGAERTETDFAAGARDLSSTGTAPYLQAELTGNKIDLHAEVVQRRLDPQPGSLLVPVDRTEGQVLVSVRPTSRLSLGLYAHRNTAYSLVGDYSDYTDQREGLRLGTSLGHRVDASAFYEIGDNRYTTIGPGVPARSDDAEAYGVEATVRLREWLSYRIGFRHQAIDSNLPGLDREISSVISTISLTTGGWIWQ